MVSTDQRVPSGSCLASVSSTVLRTTPTTFAGDAIAALTSGLTAAPAGARRSSLWNSFPPVTVAKSRFSSTWVPSRSVPHSREVREYRVIVGNADSTAARVGRADSRAGTCSTHDSRLMPSPTAAATAALIPSITISSTGATRVSGSTTSTSTRSTGSTLGGQHVAGGHVGQQLGELPVVLAARGQHHLAQVAVRGRDVGVGAARPHVGHGAIDPPVDGHLPAQRGRPGPRGRSHGRCPASAPAAPPCRRARCPRHGPTRPGRGAWSRRGRGVEVRDAAAAAAPQLPRAGRPPVRARRRSAGPGTRRGGWASTRSRRGTRRWRTPRGCRATPRGGRPGRCRPTRASGSAPPHRSGRPPPR